MKTRPDYVTRKMALAIARGNGILSKFDLIWLGIEIDVYLLKAEFLPGPKTISGNPKDRKAEIFRLAEGLWGVSPERWLEKENGWLASARAKSGSQETGGKDNLDDVISAELLIRLLAAAKYVIGRTEVGTPSVTDEVINALNLSLTEAVIKGRTRTARVGEKTIYSVLKDAGIMIGTGGGKYLPDPEISLPELFLMFHKDKVSPQAYRF